MCVHVRVCVYACVWCVRACAYRWWRILGLLHLIHRLLFYFTISNHRIHANQKYIQTSLSTNIRVLVTRGGGDWEWRNVLSDEIIFVLLFFGSTKRAQYTWLIFQIGSIFRKEPETFVNSATNMLAMFRKPAFDSCIPASNSSWVEIYVSCKLYTWVSNYRPRWLAQALKWAFSWK